MDKKLSNKIITFSSLATVACTATMFVFNQKQQSINSEYEQQVQILNNKQNELTELPEKYTKQAAAKSSTPNATQIKQTDLVVDRAENLFTQLYKINSKMTQRQWDGRRELLKRYATEEALTATGLNYNSQGINRMYDQKLKVQHIKVNTGLTSNNKLDGIVQVTYTQDSNLQDGEERLVAMYQYIYDFTSKKFTTLTPLGQVSSEQI